jgi:hypothetical protein
MWQLFNLLMLGRGRTMLGTKLRLLQRAFAYSEILTARLTEVSLQSPVFSLPPFPHSTRSFNETVTAITLLLSSLWRLS